jgi:HEAT repeat protein
MSKNEGRRWSAAWGVILTASSLAAAQPPPREDKGAPGDPVEGLREALGRFVPFGQDEAIRAHAKALQERAVAVRSLNDLARALALPGWQNRNPAVAQVQRDTYRGLVSKFEKAVKQASTHKDAAVRAALANLIARLAEADSSRGPGPDPLQQLLAKMAPDLARLAQTDDTVQAVAAARMLGKLGQVSDAAVPALADLLSSSKEPLARRAAARALGDLTSAAPLPDGSFPDARQRRRLDPRLVARVVPAVAGGLGDKDAEVRRLSSDALARAALALRQESPVPQGFPGEDARFTRQQQVLAPLVEALGKHLSAVGRCLEDDEPAVRVAACRALENAGDARQALLRLTDRSQPPKAGRDPWAMSLRALAQKLEKNLAHKEVRVKLAALYALESFADAAAPASDGVLAALKDDDAFVRWGAVRALGKMAPHAADKAVPLLAERLADENEDVCLTAALVLRRYGPKAKPAVPALGRLIGKGKTALRVRAIEAVAAIGEAKGALPALLEALAGADVEVRRSAARALTRIAPEDDKEVMKALRAALSDEDDQVRDAASAALLRGK